MNAPRKIDVAIVGAGIIGLAHAYLAARAGLSVVLFERNPQAMGASIRNFGMIWPIGQPHGELHNLALRSRELWLEMLHDIGLPYRPSGSLHAAYREDEAAVAKEFSRKAPTLGYDCAWLSAEETLARSQALRPEGLLGALWSAIELTMDPRQVVSALPRFLEEKYNVRVFFDTPVQDIYDGVVRATNGRWQADAIIVACGDDFQTLFPQCFLDSGLTRCKLQMMRTVPQPDGWQLGPSLAFGLSFNHYPTFEVCTTQPALRDRIARENPDYERFGIHVMISQTARGELTMGDSHEYGLAVNVFDNPAIDQLIFDFASTYLRVPTLEIAQRWHGVYAKHQQHPWFRSAPAEGVNVLTVTSGIGITMSFALAELTYREMGVKL